MKKNYFIFLILFLTAALNVNAQMIFHKSYGTPVVQNGHCGIQTSDSGYIAVGVTNVSGSPSDIYIVKTDMYGDLMWTKSIGDSGYDEGNSVKQTYDGGYIVSGYTTDTSTGNADICLIKLDNTGNIQWIKTYGDSSDNDIGKSVIQTFDGGYIVCGINSNYPVGNNVYVIKTDSAGNIIWSKVYGGNGLNHGKSIEQTADSGFIIAGLSSINNPDTSDVMLLRIDINGDLIWANTYGGSNSEQVGAVHITPDNGFIVCGTTFSIGPGDPNVLLFKTDAAGNLLWSKAYGGPSYDFGQDVNLNSDGGYIISGYAYFNTAIGTYAIRTDENGDTLWTRRMEIGNALSGIQTYDGGFIFTGSSGDIALLKLDSYGNGGCNDLLSSINLYSYVPQTTNLVLNVSTPNTITSNPIFNISSFGSTTLHCLTGIHETENENSFTISHDPAGNSYTVILNRELHNACLEVFSIMGEKLFSEMFSGNSTKEFHLNRLSSGVYFFRLSSKENEYTKKIFIF